MSNELIKSDNEIQEIFSSALSAKKVSLEDQEAFRTKIMFELAKAYSKRGIVMQLHLNAIRNTNKKMFKEIGADTGFDAVHDWPIAEKLAGFLSLVEESSGLPKTILYTLNPAGYYPMASIMGSFQGGGVRGKIQLGSAWWFLDHIEGMREQLKTLGALGMLPAFVGMLTDSRSFLSYPRHEYFRRIMCNLLGTWVEEGMFPADMEALEQIVHDISFENAKNYFTFSVKEKAIMQYKPEEIGKIIKMERERKHWTQIRLSKEVGVTSKQISVYENGGTTPPIDMLFKFCEIFDCELGYILGEKQYKEKTRVNTILADELGLTAKSISNLTSVTSVGELNEPQFGDFYYWDFIRNREVINKLFSSEHFKSFIIALADLENVKSSLNNSELQLWSALKDKIGEEGFEKAKYNSVYIHLLVQHTGRSGCGYREVLPHHRVPAHLDKASGYHSRQGAGYVLRIAAPVHHNRSGRRDRLHSVAALRYLHKDRRDIRFSGTG